MSRILPRTTLRSISLLSGAFAGSTTKKMDPSPLAVTSYMPKNPDGPFPYTQFDMTPIEPGNDAGFYRMARFVTHIDDNAIINVRKYYDKELPQKGRILDFCSSWISHYPPRIEQAAKEGEIEVLGTGMNKSELSQNPVLKSWTVQDLNEDPEVHLPGDEGSSGNKIDAATCVVSIDYLTKPIEVLQSIRRQTNDGGRVHLVISNRCFPNKVVGRWLEVNENERLKMVGDYLHWGGWRNIEIVTLVHGGWMKDPLWVVRGTNTGQ